jgi:hypothetical protein
MVKGKFFVASAEHATGTDPEHMQGTVKCRAVCRGATNAQWSKATPSGELTMYISNPPAFRWFHNRIGKEISLTVEDALMDPATHPYVEPDPSAADSSWMKDTCGECGLPKAEHSD